MSFILLPRSSAVCEGGSVGQDWYSRWPRGGLLFCLGNCHSLPQTALRRTILMVKVVCVSRGDLQQRSLKGMGACQRFFILNDRIMPTQLYILYAHFKQKNENFSEKNEIL